MLVSVILTASLGVWQLHRATEKQLLKDNIEAKAKQPALQDLSWLEQPFEQIQHHSVKVKGVWLADQSVYLENRQMQGQPGFFVMTPLLIRSHSKNQVIVVQRGWIPRNFQKRDDLLAIETPSQEIEISARIAHWPSRLYEFDRAETGKIRQNIYYDSMQKELPYPLLPFSLIQTGKDSEGLKRQWDFNFIKVDMHYGYAFQWFSFAIFIVVLYVLFLWLRLKKTKIQ